MSTARSVLSWVLARYWAQAAALYALFVAATALDHGGAALFGMVALTVFSIGGPLSLVGARRFWWSALGCAGLWLVSFWAYPATCEAFVGPLRDDAMAFFLPFITFPVALGAAILAHLLRRRRAPNAA